jgi:ring-1,2-phenylacetyl-CoA epoxidase subunit PaaC
MFMADAVEEALCAAGIAPAQDGIRAEWEAHVSRTLAEATLTRPKAGYMQKGGKRGVHTEHLGYILAEMQFLQRAYPGATW